MAEKEVWMATSAINVGNGASAFVRGYNARDVVPDSVVAQYGFDVAGLVVRVTIPSDGASPIDHRVLDFVTRAEVDRDLEAKVSRTGATSGQVPVLQDDGRLAFGTVTGGGGASVGDASTTVKGVLRLGGDLGGSANSPTVPGLASKVTGTGVSEVRVLTQAAYTALGTKSATTLYIIQG